MPASRAPRRYFVRSFAAWGLVASNPSPHHTACAQARKAVAIDRPFLGQDSGPAGCGVRDTFAWSPRDHTQLREHVRFDPTMAGCAFYYHPSTPNQAPAEDMRGLGKASSATMDAWKKACSQHYFRKFHIFTREYDLGEGYRSRVLHGVPCCGSSLRQDSQ